MKVRSQERTIPYPLHLLNGRLRFVGIEQEAIIQFQSELATRFSDEIPTLAEIEDFTIDFLSSNQIWVQRFETLLNFERRRFHSMKESSLIVVLEGASSTGKSMISMPLLEQLGFTRFLSTDSIRQILRSILSSEEHPELFCHTFQAYKFRQSGPVSLNPIVRGFISQVELMHDTLTSTIGRFIDEGTQALVEGVHIIPGSLQRMSTSVLEILIHPPEDIHRDMFMMKSEVSGLRTVSSDRRTRLEEFQSTREIQDFMFARAKDSAIPIIHLEDYESANLEIRDYVMNQIERIVSGSS